MQHIIIRRGRRKYLLPFPAGVKKLTDDDVQRRLSRFTASRRSR